MNVEKIDEELLEISKNIDSIAIIDFIPNDKVEEFDENFSRFFGFGISVGVSRLLPWIPIEYSSGIHYLGKDKGIPEGLSVIQLIQVRHIGGVAQEIICNCKIDKATFEKLFDKFYEDDIKHSIAGQLKAQVKAQVDRLQAYKEIERAITNIDLADKYNFKKEFVFDFEELSPLLEETRITLGSLRNDYLNARIFFMRNLQQKIEQFFQNLIPGIYLSKKEKCLSVWIYDLSNLDLNIVKKAENNSLTVDDVYEWLKKYEYRWKLSDQEEYSGTHLSLLGWTTMIDKTYEFVSLLGQNFIMGFGSEYKESYLGSYKSNYIILKLKKDPEIVSIGSLETQTALTSLSKFLFPAEWVRHLYSMILKLNEGVKELPILEYKTDIDELSSKLDMQIKFLAEEEKKRVKSISLISKISEDLRNLKSLIANNTHFLNEVKNGKSTLSEFLRGDSIFWMERIEEEIKNTSEKQSLRIQYLHDTINTLNSYINAKYQSKIERLTEVNINLTKWLVRLTWILIILALISARQAVIDIIKPYLRVD